jgi:hypothetical protein
MLYGRRFVEEAKMSLKGGEVKTRRDDLSLGMKLARTVKYENVVRNVWAINCQM